jgi:hypothetical protein
VADLSLESGTDIDRVVDDVQLPDLPVTPKRGHVHDIEWCRRTGG